MPLERFYSIPAAERPRILADEIACQHRYHFDRNAAYRRTLSARGVGPVITRDDLPRLLRPAAVTFKSYVDYIGHFPQDDPAGFVEWLGDQLSIPLPVDRRALMRRRYRTVEGLLCDIERLYSDLGIEIVSSTGTSGQASFVARDAATVDIAIRSFFLAIQRAWGVERRTTLVFMMPRETRVAMARVARVGTRRMNWGAEGSVHYTMPFSASPDRLRIRAGRRFRPGIEGIIERRFIHPFMRWANDHLAKPRYIKNTIDCLHGSVRAGRPILLLGGLAQLHAIAQVTSVDLPPGSRVATGGGMKEQYRSTPAQIRADLRRAFAGTPVSDVYGMAEANWAAFECPEGNYHIPPWVLAVVTDDNDRIVPGADAEGLLAFYDPLGGGTLIPPFFQTADRVRLVNGGTYDPALACPCGLDTSHIAGGIRRVDLVEEAGCAAQV